MSPAESHVLSTDGFVVQSPGLLRHDWLLHGASTRRLVETRDTQEAGMNRLMARLGGAGMPMVCAQQKHTNRVQVVTAAAAEAARAGRPHVFPETDALVCAQPSVGVFIFTADCVPIFLCDTRLHIVALVHAGWRGTLARIAEHTLQTMQNIGCQPADIEVWFGPCISREAYEVSPELIERFRAEFADAERSGVDFFSDRLLDLTALNVYQLEKCGVAQSRISISNLCTFGNRDLFHSYRGGNGAAGRIVSVMAVRED
ncbi:MAG: peptidoglycan editing factor PgeF [Candidatus Sumerlaeaceae bacterium]|nr:peptidoglycan editing factor PgeF [Candidatus Sumerlaeaceae bacterium]